MTSDASVTVTFFQNYAAKTKREEHYTIAALASRIHAVTAAAKAELPWLKLARFGDRATDMGSLRNDANVVACSGLEADYDDGKVPFAAAGELLSKAGITAIAYTSPSYSADFPKWRVLCPFSEELPPERRAHMLGRLVGLFATIGVEFAGESWTLSQSYYFGSVKHNPAHQVEIIDGTPIDQHDDLDEIWKGKPGTAPREGNGADSQPHSGPLDEAALCEALVSGKNYHTASVRLVGKWAQEGVPFMVAQQRLQELFDAVFPPDRNERWHKRRDDIPRIIRDIYGKDAAGEDAKANAPAAPTGEAADTIWPEPVFFFADQRRDAPALTEHHVPDAIWPFVVDTAERLGVATSSVALAAIVSLSAAISEQWQLQPKRADYTWTEAARLWGVIVGPPSILKSPIIATTTAPVERLEVEAHKRWREELAAWRERQAAAKEAKEKLDEPAPRRDRYLVESATIEALQEVLRDDEDGKFNSPLNKVLVRVDELSELFAGLDRYTTATGGSDRGAYLRLYTGGRYSIDRIIRGSFSTRSWSGCLLGGIQPNPIQRIAKQAVDDGLLQRCTLDVPATQGAGQDRAPNWPAIVGYRAIFPVLAIMRPARDSEGRPIIVKLHADAHAAREDVDQLSRA
jgi:hypothetical protein